MNRNCTIPLPAADIDLMKAEIHVQLDPELQEEVATMNSQERIQFAQKLLRWGGQLIASARELEPLEKFTMPGSAAN